MKKKNKKPQLPFRLNILFLFVFLLFSLLILQLGVVQILNGEEAQSQIDRTVDTTSDRSVPRGVMYDRYGRIILDNEPIHTITYTPPKGGEPAMDRLELAEKLANYIVIEEDSKELDKLIRERDKKEYWFLFNTQEIADRLTQEEKEKYDTGEEYQAMLNKITSEDLATIEWTDELKNIIAIKKELDAAYELSPHIVKSGNVTAEEYAVVSEHLNELPGIDAVISWDRNLIYGSTFQNYIGRISTSDEGYPLEHREYYSSMGYSRNDRVGETGIEKQYESVLRGRKEKVQYTTDKSGNIVDSEVVVEGKPGNDLVLTVDMELQQQVDKIVQEELQHAIEEYPTQNRHLNDALVAMMDPQTGEILALSGARYDREKDEYKDISLSVLYDVHAPGSVIKGATLLSGLDAGVVGMGETILDTPINIAGQIKQSWTRLGRVDDKKAIERSSNIYMMNIAIRMAGASYTYGDRLRNFDYSAFQTMRNYFSQFGLGPKTGIDFPAEASSYQGSNPQAGNLLDFAIGQYDTFSTLQLLQYVSTIANDGYRLRPQLVKEIREPEADKNELGPLVNSFHPEVLNKIEMEDKFINRVQDGFISVFHGSQGTARGYWSQDPYPSYKVAGKTGTAEKRINESDGTVFKGVNLNLIGYAPYDNPEVAFAIVVPDVGSEEHTIHHNIGKRIMDAYFNLKAERVSNGINMDPTLGEEEDLPETTTEEEIVE